MLTVGSESPPWREQYRTNLELKMAHPPEVAGTSGLNGVIVRDNVFIGRVAGDGYGYKRMCDVTVNVRIERITGRETQTVDHKTVTDPLEFAMSLSVWRPDGRDIVVGGQARDVLGELATLADGFTRQQAGRLGELWDAWHLNGMQAGCEHDRPGFGYWRQADHVVYEQGRYGRQVDLNATPACPVTGYRYGHAWLYKQLPDGFAGTLAACLPPAR